MALRADAQTPSVAVPLLEFSSIRRLSESLAADRGSDRQGLRAAAWADVSLLAEAVVGQSDEDARNILPGAAARDHVAYRLLGLGYSARETADVVAGRITQDALDTARKMLMVGRGREAAANYLDDQYERQQALRTPRVQPLPLLPDWPATNFDGAIQRYSAMHGVDARLVRAIISVESGFDPRARSRAGAIGLMQLMPGTARELGVDPFSPEQNIEGGVRYLADLLQMFGATDMALIAYNGGPGFAQRYAKGETALYGETRDYVKEVLARLKRGH